MDITPEQEIELLTRQRDRLRKDGSTGAFGFITGAMAVGYVAQWYVHAIHGNAAAMLPMIGFGCAFGGAATAVLLVTISRLRDYFSWKRKHATRMKDHFLPTRSWIARMDWPRT
ncbi:MAG: hypothetical protein WBV39_11005 [Rudaea sp.]